MKTIRYRSGMPYILSGLVVLLYALVFGLGSPLGYVGALLLAYLAYSPLTRLFPDRYAVVEDLPKAKDQAADALIQECAPHLRAIRAAGDVIYDPWLLEKVDVIAIGYRSLLRALSEDADLTEQLGPYLRYLLPNTGMLLNVRVKLQDRQLDADKVNTRKRIDEALIAIEQSLGRELSLIDQGEPLQVHRDILQMKTMLGQTGILTPETTAVADAEFLASIPERTPEELIAEQMVTQRASLLQVLQDRLAAMQAQPLEAMERPSAYAASMATPAEALVVPVAPELPVTQYRPEEFPPQPAAEEVPQWVPKLSLPMEQPWVESAVAPMASHTEESEDIQATRERLVDLLDEVVLKLEREARQEQADKRIQSDFAPVTEPAALDQLIAGAQSAFLSEDTRGGEKWYHPSVDETATGEAGEPNPATEVSNPALSYFAPNLQEFHEDKAEKGGTPASLEASEPTAPAVLPEAQQPVPSGGDNIITAWWSNPTESPHNEGEATTGEESGAPQTTPSLWAIPAEETDVPSSMPENAFSLETAETTTDPTPEATAWAGTESEEPAAEAALDQEPEGIVAASTPESTVWAGIEPEEQEEPTVEAALDQEPAETVIDPVPETMVWTGIEPEEQQEEPTAEATLHQEPAETVTDSAPETMAWTSNDIEEPEPEPTEASEPVQAAMQEPYADTTWAEEVERLRTEPEQQNVEREWPASEEIIQHVETSAQDQEESDFVVEEPADFEMPEHSAEAAQAASEASVILQEPMTEAETQPKEQGMEAEALSDELMMEAEAQPEEAKAEAAHFSAAMPQAGAWFSLEGFEDEDDLPLYKVAEPLSWVPPATSPRTAFTNMGAQQKEAAVQNESPASAPEGTDVPSVMKNAGEPKTASWLDVPALQEEKSAENLAGAMQYAMLSVQEKLQEKETDRLSARNYLEEIEKQFSVAMTQPQLDLPSEENGEESPITTFQAMPVQPTKAQRGRMTSQQIEEMVLGDILRSQGMKDFEWPETNQEYTGRKRKPRMEIDRSVLMALLGHDSSTYIQ